MTDVIVVGSGPGGANAAAALVAAGRRVRMLDYGNRDTQYGPLIPGRPFSAIRREDGAQHRFFLGERFEGVPFGPVRVGAQLTPPRMYILRDAPERIPVDSPGFSASVSLARGGLGAGWSAGVFPFDGDELAAMGLALADLQPHYDAVVERIGVSGAADDLVSFLPASPGIQPPLELDAAGEVLLERYGRRRSRLNAEGFFLGRLRAAACSRLHRNRGPCSYADMEYWADFDRAVYRPQWTLDELAAEAAFAYVDRRLVTGFREDADGVVVQAVHAETGAREEHRARALVLAAGTIATAWLVLRSLDRVDAPVPMLCNPYSYAPMLNLGMLRRPTRDRRHSLAQLTAIVRLPGAEQRLLQAQVFSYRSLLTFKLLKEVPVGHRDALRLLRLLMPKIAVLGIHHEDRPTPGKTCTLRRDADGRERLEIRYAPDPVEARRQRDEERTMRRFFRRLGCVPLATIHPGHGASIHYAGTFPICPGERPLTCDRDSRLRGTRAVYLADGSVFPWLPPKGLTFNIMANADRVGTLLARRLA